MCTCVPINLGRVVLNGSVASLRTTLERLQQDRAKCRSVMCEGDVEFLREEADVALQIQKLSEDRPKK